MVRIVHFVQMLTRERGWDLISIDSHLAGKAGRGKYGLMGYLEKAIKRMKLGVGVKQLTIQ